VQFVGSLPATLAIHTRESLAAFTTHGDRDSKLTRLLEDALGGSARTALIACATPLPGGYVGLRQFACRR
jgi:hypothetical protein